MYRTSGEKVYQFREVINQANLNIKFIGAYPSSYPMGTGGSFTGGKGAGA